LLISRTRPATIPHTNFFIGHVPNQDLHSFPTRRSSDLAFRSTRRCRRPRPTTAGSAAGGSASRGRSPHTRASPVGSPSLAPGGRDRKSTRLNSSHVAISYAVFCLKKKNKTENEQAQLYT